MLHNIFAILGKRVCEAFRHENVASKDTSKRRAFDFIDGVGKVICPFVLLQSQLKLAYGFLYLKLKHHVLSLLLGQSVVHLDDSITFDVAQLINCVDSHFQVINRVKHDLGSQQIADLAFCFNFLYLSLFDHLRDFLGPCLHNAMNHVSDADALRLLAFSCLLQGFVNLADDRLNLFLSELFLEHFLEDSQDNFVLLPFIPGNFHTDPVKGSVGLFPNVVD